MKAKELRELPPEELLEKHDELWTELFGLRIKHALGQLENPLRLRDIRRDIARTKTLLTQHGVQEVSRKRNQQRPPLPEKTAKPKRARKPEGAKSGAAAKTTKKRAIKRSAKKAAAQAGTVRPGKA